MKKKLLLGTTALIAAGVVAGGLAQAAEEPITAGVSGYFRTAMATISQDDATGELAENNHSHTLATDIEIQVSGNTMLDNGITAGFRAMIEGNGTGDGSEALDERFIFFRGGFGQIRVGQTESARHEMSNNTPTGNWSFGINSPFFQFGNGGGPTIVRTGNDGLGNEDSLKLVYFSPTFNGFRLGASYAPDGGSNGQYGGNARNVASSMQNEASIAAEFSTALGDDMSLRLSTGYEGHIVEQAAATAATIQSNNSPNAVNFGGTITIGEWSIGGEYQESDQVAPNNSGGGMDREDLALGILYASGPYTISLGWAQAEVDQATLDTDELEIWKLQGDYVVGPGISIGGGVVIGDFDDATAGAGLDNEYTTGVLTAALSF
jgi:hypothetical protein